MSEHKCCYKTISGQVRHECNDTSYFALFIDGIYVGDIYDESEIGYISNAVNEHDQLKAKLEKAESEVAKLRKENEQYKQAYSGIKDMMQKSINAFSALGLKYFHVQHYRETIKQINELCKDESEAKGNESN